MQARNDFCGNGTGMQHVTHRCHNRDFLLRFERDRRNYVSRLRETSGRFAVEVLDYTITSNHVHLLLWTPSLDDLSAAMQFLQGVSARDYNRRKARQGAYWSDRYSAVPGARGRRIEHGERSLAAPPGGRVATDANASTSRGGVGNTTTRSFIRAPSPAQNAG